MTDSKRGRKSQANYRELVAKALRSDRFTFDEFPVLSQLPAIEQWAAAHGRELLPHGKALQVFLRHAIEDVSALSDALGDAHDDAHDMELARTSEPISAKISTLPTVPRIGPN